jgi:hypothetical protein
VAPAVESANRVAGRRATRVAETQGLRALATEVQGSDASWAFAVVFRQPSFHFRSAVLPLVFESIKHILSLVLEESHISHAFVCIIQVHTGY